MNLKTLVLVIAVLAVASVAVFWIQRPATPPATAADARVGSPVLPVAVAEQAARLTLADEGRTVELARGGEGEAAAWRVTNYHNLPADFAKLTRLVRDLTTTQVERRVTTNPARLERLGFGDTQLTLADAAGTTLWSVTLGRTAEGGGRFLRFGEDSPAYLARLNAWLDATPRNWADSTLVALNSADIARVELSFPNADTTVTATRPDAATPFTVEAPPAGQQLRPGAITGLLGSLTTLRFTQADSSDAPDAAAARAHARTVRLTTFDGSTTTIELGRRPPTTTLKAPEPGGPAALGSLAEADTSTVNESLQPSTETTPAGPVYARVTYPNADDPRHRAADRLAFRVADFAYTNLPAAPAELFEPVPSAKDN